MQRCFQFQGSEIAEQTTWSSKGIDCLKVGTDTQPDCISRSWMRDGLKGTALITSVTRTASASVSTMDSFADMLSLL